MDEYNNLSNSSDEEKQFIISKLREYITKFKIQYSQKMVLGILKNMETFKFLKMIKQIFFN